jgi:hypothetical protein
MQTIYLNIKTSQGVETVDEFTRGENAPQNPKEFKAFLNTMIHEYIVSGQNVYKSTRSTKEWKNKN